MKTSEFGTAATLARWFMGSNSGCYFASHFAQENTKRLLFGESLGISESTPDEINDHFDSAHAASFAGVMIFPHIRNRLDLDRLLELLAANERWCRTETTAHGHRDVRLQWTTPHGALSETMGLAPLLSMPVTRRAPYVAIAAWPGEPQDPAASETAFIDMNSDLDEALHRTKLKQTQSLTRTMLAGDAHAKHALRKIAFCLD